MELATGLSHYNRWAVSLFKGYFGENILEIGSGLGGLSRLLPQTNITLSDTRDDYFNYLKNQFDCKTLKLDIENEAPNDLTNSFDTVIAINVLEHIENDERAMKNCRKLLQKNGKLLLFVPARPEIFGVLDNAMGHYQRYTKEELAKKAIGAGFNIIKLKYVNLPGYFSWWLRGRFSGGLSSDNLTAKMFDLLIVPFLYLEKYLPIPFGQSLMLVAEKP